MSRRKRNLRPVFWVIALLLYPALTFADEGAKAPEETAAQVRQAIESYVKKDIALKDSFLFVDPQTGKPMSFTFDHVHQSVNKVDGEYVACVDFQHEGKTYDVDFFVQPQGEQWEVTRLRAHKINGQEVKH